MHSLLKRQLERRDAGGARPAEEGWQQVLVAVDAAYHAFDADRLMLERSLDLSSQELLEANTTLREQARVLHMNQEWLRALMENANEAIISSDSEGNVTFFNPGAESLFGYSAGEVLGRPLTCLMPERFHQTHQAGLQQFLAMGEARVIGTAVGRRKDGSEFPLEHSLGSGTTSEGVFFTAVLRDISERQEAEETIRHLAYHDALTDLPNRSLFEERLGSALKEARGDNQMMAVMFLDLDRFKTVNDSVGHAEGDMLLRQVAGILTNLVRQGDTVARMGGDEFTVLLPNAQPGDADRIAEEVLAALSRPIALRGHVFQVTASIGITVYPKDGQDVETLLRNADTAMYRAKEQGRNRFQFFAPSMNATIVERLDLESDLRGALERGEFVLYYQPLVDATTLNIVGAEALIRWSHPQRGLVMPGVFIPSAEDTGLIVPIGEWVLREACAQASAWQHAGLGMRVSVNVSPVQFWRSNLAMVVNNALAETGLAPSNLQLEITEGLAMHDAGVAIDMMRDLRQMGVGISIDDFGTGYSSLSYLKTLPVEAIKIDQSFVRDLTIDPNDAAIATAIIAMSHSLGYKVIAEGVETKEQLAFLRQKGCDEVQGYLLGKPMPAAELEKTLARPRATVPSFLVRAAP